MALPYLLSSEEYFDFNSEYYIFSLLVVLTGFGFEFAYYRFPTSLLNLLKMLVLNSAIFLTILYFGGLIRRIGLNLLIIVLTAFAFIIVNIFQFTLLFNKQKKKYFIFSLIFYSIFLLSIPVHFLFGIHFFYLFALFAVLGFILAILYVYKAPENSKIKVNKYYQFGFNALIINGFITLVLSINHLTANILFEKGTANTIIIAWMFTMPILHAGNIAEKVFYNSGHLVTKYKKWVAFLFVGISVYILAFFLALEFVPSLFPKMIVKDLFFSTSIFLLPALGIYAIFNAPLNAFVFKYLRAKQQRFITVYLGSTIVLLYFLSIYNLNSGIEAENLLLKSLGFFAIPIIVKFIAVSRVIKKRRIAHFDSAQCKRGLNGSDR
ncbi:MAG: hypothetical protein PF445_00255 [Melioribacteraceae bacterium]|jgi:hypothetical protein|nr:hypothetical protein [Melioribacteraceae bacterium]